MTRYFIFVLAITAGIALDALSARADSGPRPGVVGSGKAISKANELILSRLRNVYRCANRIWPGWAADNFHVLVGDKHDDSAVLVSGKGAPGEKSAVPPYVSAVPFDMAKIIVTRERPVYTPIQWNGLGRILAVFHAAISEVEIDKAVEVIVHEGFHFSGQQQFARTSNFPRGVHYPENPRIRYLRHKISAGLGQASDGNSFGGIAFWAKELDAIRAGSLMREIDRIEGSAQYVQIYGSEIARQGCDSLDDNVVLAGFARLGAFTRGSLSNPGQANVDFEAYAIGALAGLHLQRSGRAGWRQAVEKGATPLELLVENVTPEKQPEDRGLLAQIETAVGVRNEKLKPRLEGFRNLMRSVSQLIISVPGAQLGAPYISQGFVTYEAEHGAVQLVGLGAHAARKRGENGGDIGLKGKDIQITNETPCASTNQAIFPIAKSAVTDWGKDTVNIVDDQVLAASLRVVKREQGGMQWLCVH